MKTCGRLYVAALENGRYHQWNLTKGANRQMPVVDNETALVVEIVQRIRWIYSMEALPHKHDRGVMGSAETPVLLHFVEACDIVMAEPSLPRKG